MKKRFKKVYCENCNKELLVEEGEFFCPICASYLTDKGEIVEKEIINDDKQKKGKAQPKKKALNDSGIIVLEGAKKNKEIFNKTKLNKVKTTLSSITFILLMVAIGLFYFDLSNKVNLIKEWTTRVGIASSYIEYTHQIYFISEKNCNIFSILLGAYFLLTAIIVLINAINKLTACSIEARYRMSAQAKSNKTYYDGLSKIEKSKINDEYHIDYYYDKIRLSLYVLLVFAIINSILLVALSALSIKVLGNYEYFKEVFLHFNGQDVSINLRDSNILIGLIAGVVLLEIISLILNIIFASRNNNLNNAIKGLLSIRGKEDYNTYRSNINEEVEKNPNSRRGSVSNEIIMPIDDFIEDEKGQIGVIGTIKSSSLKAGDMIGIMDKNGEIIEINVRVNEVHKDVVIDGKPDIDFNAEAYPGDEVCIMFYAETDIRKGMKLIKE